MVKYSLDDHQSQQLANAMKEIPSKAERLVNDTLKAKGMKIMIQGIIGFIPVGKRNTKHAKTSNSLSGKMVNLGFEIKPKKQFYYLVFPNRGEGPRNPAAKLFFEKGADNSSDKILNEVIKALEEANEFKL